MGVLDEIVNWSVSMGVGAAVFAVIYGRYRLKMALEFKACKEIPPTDDAEMSLKKMMSFICFRMKELDFPAIHNDGVHPFTMLDTFGDVSKSPEIVTLINMAHAVGCEVVLRPRKEGREGGGESEGDSFVTSMREEWYAHEGDPWTDTKFKR